MAATGTGESEELARPPGVLAAFQLDGRNFVVTATDDPLRSEVGVREVCRFMASGQHFVISEKAAGKVAGILDALTARELQVAALVAEGCPNKQIADRLCISEWTVATYLRRIFDKLGVDSRAAMTYRCASLIAHWPPTMPRAVSSARTSPP